MPIQGKDCVLNGFTSPWHNWENASTRLALPHFLNWWVICESPDHCGQSYPWASGPRYCKKAGWVSHKMQISKLHSFMASASVPALTSYPDFLSWWTMMWKYKLNNPLFSPNLLLIMVGFFHNKGTSKTDCLLNDRLWRSGIWDCEFGVISSL